VASTAAARRELTYAEARERVLAAARTLPGERVPLDDARGRALLTSIVASHDVPPFRNASMDGVAVHSSDLASAAHGSATILPIVEVIAAGHVASRPLRKGEAMRIMTGAAMPDGADAVVPVEELETLEGNPERVRIQRTVEPDLNVRDKGLDLARGDEAFAIGRELSPLDLGLLATLGEAQVTVGRRPRVSVFSTGDELLAADQPLQPGAIRDGNLPALTAMLAECGASVARAARLRDDPADVSRAVRQALETQDVVITIGGVSAGDFDPVKESLPDGVELWRVAMKPGRPQAFGAPGGRLFFGVPGNPASVVCVFEALVRPALRKLQGFAVLDRPRLTVRAAEAFDSRVARTDFVRVTLEWQDGVAWARSAGAQVSGHLTPQSRAHALLVIPDERAALASGDWAEALVLRWP
jgi:molybdopterin molybdotransferase